MENFNVKNLRNANYMIERINTSVTYNKKTKDKWLKAINLSEENQIKYFEKQKKSKEEFFSCLEQFDVILDNQPWINEFTEMLNVWDTLYEKKLNISDEISKHPFFVFSKHFAVFCYSRCEFCTFAIQNAVNNKICELVHEYATKILLEELWIYKKDNSGSNCYYEYCENFKNSVFIKKLANKYPLMFRVIIEQCKNILKFYKTVENNYSNDLLVLKNKFHLNGDLIYVENNAGDSHCGKKQVIVFHFEKGTVIYKPRNLELDIQFEKLINYINKKLNVTLICGKIYNKGIYGWQEFIEYKDCTNQLEVKEFYYKIGIFACIFYILSASDMHMENIICHGKDPVFIDLESIFQSFKGFGSDNQDIYVSLSNIIRNSVLLTCLFPAGMNMSSQRDISGITGHGGQVVSKGKYSFENKYTSEMKIIREDFIMKDKKNIPQINGKRVEPRVNIVDIIKGFSDTFDVFLNNKNDFIKQNGIIDSFNNLPIRTIIRHTANYSTLLKASTEKKYLIDAANRNLLFDRLWIITENQKGFSDIVCSEIEDLLLGDIPYFFTYINSDHIFNSKGEMIKNYKIIPMQQQIKKVISILNTSEKKLQIDFIQKAMAIPIKRWELKSNKQDFTKISNAYNHLMIPEKTLEFCRNIIARILDIAYIDIEKKEIAWIDLKIEPNEQWSFTPADNSLYSGIMGIALPLAEYYKRTLDPDIKKYISMILHTSFLYEEKYNIIKKLSAYNGTPGTAYCYYYIASVFDNQSLKNFAVELLLSCENLINKDKDYDIVSGSAGALIIAVRLYKKTLRKDMLNFAIKCGEHLLEHVISKSVTYGWYTISSDNTILAGFSHGNSGIAWAMMELFGVTQNQKYKQCAERAINYENTLYNAEDNNWVDLRNRENRIKKEFPEPVNWCHGAPGIGLSRIACKKISPDSIIDIDIKNAIAKTIKEGFGGSDCLCHGSFGNLEILLEASKLYPESSYYNQAMNIAYEIRSELDGRDVICGIPQKNIVPGFMIGLSGIAFGTLRLIAPNDTPNVLLFELPS